MNVVDEVTGLLLLSTTATSSGTGAGQTPSPPPQQQQQQPPFDVTSSSGREALLLRFLQLLPSTLDLQQPLNQPSPTMNGTSSASEAETTSRACQQLVSEVVTALRLWVMQQPLTLGRPLGDDNPSLFALLRPQLRQLHWWRAPQGHAVASTSTSSSVAPPHYPTSAASPPPEPPVGDDLLALAWGNRAWQPPVAASPAAAAVGQHKTEEGSPTLSSPGLATSPARGLTVPLVKVEQHNNVGVAAHPGGANNGAFARAQHHPAGPTGAVIGTIKVPGPMPVAGPTNSNEGFEFNENDSAAPHSSAVAVLSKRRRSMDASFEAAGGHLLGRPPVRDQALRKRRKSVIDRTTTGSVRSEETTTAPAPREMRKRKASLPPSTAPNPNGAGLGDDGSLSPKKTKFDDEDYIDTGRESGGGDKDKEGQRDVADSATPIRGIRGRGRGRGTRGMKARGGRGGRSGGNSSAHSEKDLDGVPKTKARKPESCHRCKNKKEFWVGCPLVASHKYCRGCVVRHFSIDYDDFRANPENYWTDGCPICHLTCPCIGCVRKKKNGQSGAEDDKVDIEKDEDDEVGDPDEDEDDDGADGYDEEGDGDEEDDVHVDVDNDEDEDEDEMSEERSAESLIEVRWSALKRQLDVKDAAAAADSTGTGQHLPVKKRMSRMRSNSFANGGGPSSRSGSSSSSSSFLDEPYTPQQTHQQPPRKRAPRLRSYSTSHCEPKPSAVAAMNPEDYLGRTGAGNVLAARYSSPMRRGSRGFNSRANH